MSNTLKSLNVQCEVCAENETRSSNGTSKRLVEKLWAFCSVLRDDGVGTIDYTEQLTFLLFLKMAHERATRSLNPEKIVPDSCSWQRLLDATGDSLEKIYRDMLATLSTESGMLGVIFRKAQNKIQDPAKLKKLIVDLIDQENWSATGVDIKGDAYEGLLAKGAEDVKSGAGQYFTPRALIAAIVEVIAPTPEDRVCDPACGTGGFLLSSYEHAVAGRNLTPEQRENLQNGFANGTELVENTARLASMNMLLHGMGKPNGPSPIDVRDALTSDDGKRYSVVLANPPFGTKSSVTMVGSDGKLSRNDLEIVRDDFWVTTSNKQLNFLQHIKTILDINGRAAVVLPDNVLFDSGAGETVRRRLLKEFDCHTLLRLPTGIFYAGGVQANVLFFDKRPASESPWTEKLWVYDFRTNMNFTPTTKILKRSDLNEFVTAFCISERHKRQETDRFKAFTLDEILSRPRVSLDFSWLKSDNTVDGALLEQPEVIAREIINDLSAALDELQAIVNVLEDRQ